MKFKVIPNSQTPEVDDSYKKLAGLLDNQKLLTKFLKFARSRHNCVGLAANQVSLDGERIMEPFFALKDGHFWNVFLMPIILKYKGKPVEKQEGCLTWVGCSILAKRYPEINVQYYNLKGEKKIENLYGFTAQIFQHEYNHLIGVEEDVYPHEGVLK